LWWRGYSRSQIATILGRFVVKWGKLTQIKEMTFRLKTIAAIVILTMQVTLLSGCIGKATNTLSTSPITTMTTPAKPTPTSPAAAAPTSTVLLPTGTDLAFETIVQPGRVGGPYTGDVAQIQAIDNAQIEPAEVLEWVYPDDKAKILAVDYTKYFVLMIFNGYRGGISSYLKIWRVWQGVDSVFVLVHFNDIQPSATSLPAYNSQYQVVQISRTQITQFGAIAFKLLDEAGRERATSIETISKPNIR
jgi:hypothetical protein